MGRFVKPQVEPKSLRTENMASSSTQNRMLVLRDLQIPLVSTLWLVFYSLAEFLFQHWAKTFLICARNATDSNNPVFFGRHLASTEGWETGQHYLALLRPDCNKAVPVEKLCFLPIELALLRPHLNYSGKRKLQITFT